MDYRLPKAEMDRKGVSTATVDGQCRNGLSMATSRNESERGIGSNGSWAVSEWTNDCHKPKCIGKEIRWKQSVAWVGGRRIIIQLKRGRVVTYRNPQAEMNRKRVSVATVAGKCRKGLSIATNVFNK